MGRNAVGFAALAFACVGAFSQPLSPLAKAAQTALETSPDVSARLNALKAAVEEIDVASGNFLPRLDLDAELGRTRDKILNRIPETQTLNRNGVSLTLSQLLWDGLATSSEVGRLGHVRLTRYFEFVDASEQAALEAARAYFDVQRFRRFVRLAEDNYVQHKYAYDQIAQRVRAGVGRGVDLEQAGARLALAESNLVTEKANLHDVSERYRRVIGEAPPADLPPVSTMARPMPATLAAAIESAAAGSPTIAAAIENLRAAKAQSGVAKSSYQPRIEARIRGGTGHNFDGVFEQRNDTTAQIVLNWNLFNGGSDIARDRQVARLIDQAADLRDKACRDIRQTVAIAYNDTRKLTEQLVYLDRNVIAIEKARDAYRQQFDIGQRSLLDLLNAENELYTARHAYVGTEYDLSVANARTFAAGGSLVTALGLSRLDVRAQSGDTDNWTSGEDSAGRCPLAPTELEGSAKAELDRRARDLLASTPALPAGATTPAATTPAPAAPAPDAAAQRVAAWAAAWSARDVDRYLAFYSPTFKPSSGDRARWAADRRRTIERASQIEVRIENLQTAASGANRVETRFDQTYRSQSFQDRTRKTLVWELQGGQWLIVSESNR